MSIPGDQPQHIAPNTFFVFELFYLVTAMGPFGLWILTISGNVFRAKHLWRVFVFTETKVATAVKATIVTTGILQMHKRPLEKHRSTGNVDKNCVFVVRF